MSDFISRADAKSQNVTLPRCSAFYDPPPAAQPSSTVISVSPAHTTTIREISIPDIPETPTFSFLTESNHNANEGKEVEIIKPEDLNLDPEKRMKIIKLFDDIPVARCLNLDEAEKRMISEEMSRVKAESKKKHRDRQNLLEKLIEREEEEKRIAAIQERDRYQPISSSEEISSTHPQHPPSGKEPTTQIDAISTAKEVHLASSLMRTEEEAEARKAADLNILNEPYLKLFVRVISRQGEFSDGEGWQELSRWLRRSANFLIEGVLEGLKDRLDVFDSLFDKKSSSSKDAVSNGPNSGPQTGSEREILRARERESVMRARKTVVEVEIDRFDEMALLPNDSLIALIEALDGCLSDPSVNLMECLDALSGDDTMEDIGSHTEEASKSPEVQVALLSHTLNRFGFAVRKAAEDTLDQRMDTEINFFANTFEYLFRWLNGGQRVFRSLLMRRSSWVKATWSLSSDDIDVEEPSEEWVQAFLREYSQAHASVAAICRECREEGRSSSSSSSSLKPLHEFLVVQRRVVEALSKSITDLADSARVLRAKLTGAELSSLEYLSFRLDESVRELKPFMEGDIRIVRPEVELVSLHKAWESRRKGSQPRFNFKKLEEQEKSAMTKEFAKSLPYQESLSDPHEARPFLDELILSISLAICNTAAHRKNDGEREEEASSLNLIFSEIVGKMSEEAFQDFLKDFRASLYFHCELLYPTKGYVGKERTTEKSQIMRYTFQICLECLNPDYRFLEGLFRPEEMWAWMAKIANLSREVELSHTTQYMIEDVLKSESCTRVLRVKYGDLQVNSLLVALRRSLLRKEVTWHELELKPMKDIIESASMGLRNSPYIRVKGSKGGQTIKTRIPIILASR